MISLITGLPGAGKSLRLVQRIRQLLAEGRAVYVDGLDGLQAFGWEPCDARNWRDLPDGSVIVVDEAQKVWPSRRAGEPPDEIRALSEHRHWGFDFILATQHPTMLDSYVRKLVGGGAGGLGQHEHVLRQFGMQASRIVTWAECQDDPQSLMTRQRGTETLWKYPPECFPLYKSATLHTVKRRIPLRIAVLPLLLVLVVVLGVWGWRAVHQLAGSTPAAAPLAQPTPQGAVGPGGVVNGSKFATPGAYVENFVPRVPAQPWSAPWHDDAKPQAEPDLLCISTAEKCQCYTEQITPIMGVPNYQCRLIARHGIYNPFRQPLRLAEASRSRDRDRDREDDDKRGRAVASSRVDALPVPRSAPGANADTSGSWPHPDFRYQVPFPAPSR